MEIRHRSADMDAESPSLPRLAVNPNSMVLWLPRVLELADVRPHVPTTIIIDSIPVDQLVDLVDGRDLDPEHWQTIRNAASQLGYPLFMRTDLMSAKHDYRDTCYVGSLYDLRCNLPRLIEAHFMADIMGPRFSALALREFLPLDARFVAGGFGRLPIAAERRYFVRDGAVVCRHPYWPADAIESGLPESMIWRKQLDDLNTEKPGEFDLLSALSARIGTVLEGYWSLDYARTRHGGWRFIDAATGGESWHPADCPNA